MLSVSDRRRGKPGEMFQNVVVIRSCGTLLLTNIFDQDQFLDPEEHLWNDNSGCSLMIITSPVWVGTFDVAGSIDGCALLDLDSAILTAGISRSNKLFDKLSLTVAKRLNAPPIR